MNQNINDAITLLTEVKDDRFAPKNVKTTVEEAINILKAKNEDSGVNVDKVLQMLEEITSDPNLDMTIRTMIWNVVSVLEAQ